MVNLDNVTQIIKCGALLEGPELTFKEGHAILIEKEKIKDIVSLQHINSSTVPDIPIIDLSKYTILPGLVDTHVHIETHAETDHAIFEDSIAKRTLGAAANVKRALYSGVTSMRVMGTHNFIDVAMRDAVSEGLIEGPRLQAAGYLISMTGGHGMELECHSCDLPILTSKIFGGVADGDVEMRKLVRYSLRQGVDLIKVSATGGTLSQGANVGAQQLNQDEIEAAVEEANKAGIPVAAHAHGNAGIKAALRAGVASIEHGSYLDDEAIELMLGRGVYMCPTLYNLNVDLFRSAKRLMLKPHVEYRTESLRRALNKSFKVAVAAGVKIIVGSDSTYIPGRFGIVTEMEWFVKLGMSHTDTLLAATAYAAEAMGLKGKVGSLQPGAYADLIAVTGNPKENISLLHDTRYVMKGGVTVREHARDPDDLANAQSLTSSPIGADDKKVRSLFVDLAERD